MAATATGANPHASVDEGVALITAFHGQVEAVLVRGRVDGVCVIGVLELLKNVLGTG